MNKLAVRTKGNFPKNFFLFSIMKKAIRKGRWLRRMLRTFFALLILFIIACLIFDHYYRSRRSNDELKPFYCNYNMPATIGYYETHGRKLRYVRVGDEEGKGTLVFLHGSPGSMSYYAGRFRDKDMLDK